MKDNFQDKLLKLKSGINYETIDKTKSFTNHLIENKEKIKNKEMFNLYDFNSLAEESTNKLKSRENYRNLDSFLSQKRITDYKRTTAKEASKLIDFDKERQIEKEREFNKDLRDLNEIRRTKQTFLSAKNNNLSFNRPVEISDLKRKLILGAGGSDPSQIRGDDIRSKLIKQSNPSNKPGIKQPLIEKNENDYKTVKNNNELSIFEELVDKDTLRKLNEEASNKQLPQSNVEAADRQLLEKLINAQQSSDNGKHTDNIRKDLIHSEVSYPYDNSNGRSYEESAKWDGFQPDEFDIFLYILSSKFYNEQSRSVYLPLNYYTTNEYTAKWLINFYSDLKNMLLGNSLNALIESKDKDMNKFIKEDLVFTFQYSSRINDNISAYSFQLNKKEAADRIKDGDMLLLVSKDTYDSNTRYKLGDSSQSIIAYFKQMKVNEKSNLICLVYEESLSISNNCKIIEKQGYYGLFAQSLVSQYREFISLISFNKLNQDLTSYIRKPPRSLSYQENEKTTKHIHRYLSSLNYNDSQLKAISLSVTFPKKSFLLIQGPPGTGKTHTINGILSAIMMKNEKSKVLICTPSNTAVDEILKRVVSKRLITKSGELYLPKVLRFGAQERLKNLSKEEKHYHLSNSLKEYSFEYLVEKEMSLQNPLLIKEQLSQVKAKLEKAASDVDTKLLKEEERKLTSYLQANNNNESFMSRKRLYEKNLILDSDLIFTTLNSAGNDKMKVLEKRYDYLIIDEACQSTEPSSVIPFHHSIDRVIMVGDHKQLSATVFADKSDMFNTNYSKSLFERLVDNNHSVIFLDTQYRMHPRICKIISDSFYESKLLSAQSLSLISEHQIYRILNEKQCFSFFAVNGKETSIRQSYINNSELKAVEDIISLLSKAFSRSSTQLIPSIGVISPYKEQVRYLRDIVSSVIRDTCLEAKVKIETVDSFQGQEEDIVIISTVRSSAIGFLNDYRRLNVAISRAKFGCYIFGSLRLLSQDQSWRRIISYCKESSSLCSYDEFLLEADKERNFKGILI